VTARGRRGAVHARDGRRLADAAAGRTLPAAAARVNPAGGGADAVVYPIAIAAARRLYRRRRRVLAGRPHVKRAIRRHLNGRVRAGQARPVGGRTATIGTGEQDPAPGRGRLPEATRATAGRRRRRRRRAGGGGRRAAGIRTAQRLRRARIVGAIGPRRARAHATAVAAKVWRVTAAAGPAGVRVQIPAALAGVPVPVAIARTRDRRGGCGRSRAGGEAGTVNGLQFARDHVNRPGRGRGCGRRRGG
jgi:hypothetical protein